MTDDAKGKKPYDLGAHLLELHSDIDDDVADARDKTLCDLAAAYENSEVEVEGSLLKLRNSLEKSLECLGVIYAEKVFETHLASEAKLSWNRRAIDALTSGPDGKPEVNSKYMKVMSRLMASVGDAPSGKGGKAGGIEFSVEGRDQSFESAGTRPSDGFDPEQEFDEEDLSGLGDVIGWKSKAPKGVN